MKTITTVSGIELTKEECEVLYKAENLLDNMKTELEHYGLSNKELDECIKCFSNVTSKYNVHITCDPNY